ncbi:MFS transporter [Candidatus Pacearchaeota archaeon]|nr:MFS transporter [Candidatus Pacearchaeota archaeon]
MAYKKVRLSEREIEKAKKEALRTSIFEGGASSVMTGTSSYFITPYALALKASNLQIGFLSSFVGLIGPLAQLGSSHLMERYSRKKIVIVSVIIQALIWIPIMLLGVMFYFDIWQNLLPLLLIIFYSLHVGIGAVAGPAWFSWMGDIVPEKHRGWYFAKRNKIVEGIAIFSMFAAGLLLDLFKTKGLVFIGFSILFSIGMISRLYSGRLLSRQYQPSLKLRRGYYFSFWQFLGRMRKTNFGKFTIFISLMYFAVAISAPFFTVYMLKELNLSYTWFTIINLSSSVFSILTYSFWGKITDKYGNRFVIVVSSLAIPLVPILWMFSTSKLYLILIPSLIGGIFWGGFAISTFNFVYDSTKQNHRALCVTYNNLLTGIGIFLGSALGGLIANYGIGIASIFGLNIFLFIFLISGVLRLIITIIFIPLIKEVRITKKKPHMLTRELRPLWGFEHHGLHNFRSSHLMHIPFITSKQIGKFEKIFHE